ncbi:hypothetical protein ABB30_14920 [Stenotrophomonas ginsengisoli]|uniref:OmpA-like domain-containing protein n=1 Tax=Stenotrophomonas ginsengisoli TaxID=336566 RepID=A0A0R0D9W1_9GAMM|nr:OmpA family protein [Stenotrophomonas ginsengisoli]KRG73944.1 hypothetical protein ABB30_14920 [Stenotrophomonas ginsengisoli]
MFDALIREATERFGLGDKARPFISLLISMIFDKGHNGFAGLRERFHQVGLGDAFGSWISGQAGDNVLQPDQFSSVVGNDHVTSMASKLGVPNAAVTVAGATLLPKLISLLTPNGSIPVVPPAEAGHLLLDQRDRQSTAAAFRHSPANAAPAGGSAGWLKWLVMLAILVIAVLLARSCMKQDTPATSASNASTTTPAANSPAAQADARFGMETAAGKVTVSGQVPSEADKTRLWDALVATFGAGNVNGDIRVDTNTLPAGWLDKLIAALPELKADGIKLGFDGDKLHIDTNGLDDEQRFGLSDKLRGLFGGYEISGLWDRAAAALSGLKAGFTGDELVGALNLMNIYFDTGSASITRDSQQTLRSAADAIKQAPADTRIEVAGHTDNTGDAAANLTLSQQRADAVATRLGELGVSAGVLSTKGYGQEKPRADNATEEGKAQNRRIEFSVVK